MTKQHYPVTPAVRVLRQAKVEYAHHLYEYKEQGGAAWSAEALQLDIHAVVKTLIMENDNKQPLIVLMHGDKAVSTKQLARQLGAKNIQPCDPAIAQKHSGYLVGGTSPFGTKRSMPVYLESSILQLPKVYINGGKRGYLVSVSPQAIMDILKPKLVEVAVD